MSKTYDDARFGITKFLTFPGHCDNIAAAGNVSHMVFDEDIVLTEFGIVVTEYVTGTAATVQLREGSTVLGEISVTALSTVGTVLSTTTLTTTAINSGNTLIFYRNISTITTGECDGYIKYRERFVSG